MLLMPRLNDDTICKQVFDGDCYNDDAMDKNIAMDASVMVMVLLLLKAIFTMLMTASKTIHEQS